MTPEDTNRIVDAIDRNTEVVKRHVHETKAVATAQTLTTWMLSVLVIPAFFYLSGCPRAKATPLLPPLSYEIGTPPLPPLNPHLQYWHTQWVPGPDGVLPVEVFAPRLVAKVASDAEVVDVPEPGTLKVFLVLLLTGAMATAVYWVYLWLGIPLWIAYATMHLCWFNTACKSVRRAEALRLIANSSHDEDSREVARKALEEK